MYIRVKRVGRTRGHRRQGPTDVHVVTLDNATLRVSLSTYGASIWGLLAPDRHGRKANVVVRLPDLRAYERDRHLIGCTLGRYARCIANSRFRLGPQIAHLTANRPPHHFHGGVYGFNRFVWMATPFQKRDAVGVRFRLERPAGDEGYPGAIAVSATYELRADRLKVTYTARSDARTIVDMTSHTFWNLRGHGAIDTHTLRLHASRVIPTDRALIPIGPPIAVAGGAHDYRRARPMIDPIDACLALDSSGWAAVLYEPESGRLLRIRTDQPGLAVYTGDGLARPRSGLCLQPGSWPDAPNRPDFPSCRLEAGELYRHHTSFRISIRD